jgi:hypothetical protein
MPMLSVEHYYQTAAVQFVTLGLLLAMQAVQNHTVETLTNEADFLA